jgi:capsular exopolysaccharide synthesis family protein
VAQPLRAVSASSAALLEICRRPLWHGDSSELLFLGGARRTIATEQLRNLRSQLTEMRTRRTLKSVVISSSSPSEGKTFVAANLAYAFARQHDRRILLLDADLRRSRLPTLLGAPAEPGLNEYLRGAATEEQILQRSPQENLFFIPGGKPAANPGDLLAGGKLKKLLEQLTPLFDWILVDTPAGGEIPDARLVADCCDGVLLVIQTGVTPRKAAQLAAREFPRDRLLGVVLNQAAVR